MATTASSSKPRDPPVAGAKRRLSRRWAMALCGAATCLALMVALAAVQGGGCQPATAPGFCIEIPIWVFYVLHAAAIVCSLWAIFAAVRELLDAHRLRTRAAQDAVMHR